MDEIPGCPERGGKANVCRGCNQIKTCNQMKPRANKPHSHETQCQDCATEYQRRYYKDNIDKIRQYRADNALRISQYFSDYRDRHADELHDKKLRRQFGITTEQYDAILISQSSCCAICKKPCVSGRRLSIDHDHRCCPTKRSCGNCIRGLLCTKCNPMLGYADDNPNLLEAAADYLKHYRQNNDRDQAA